MSSVNHIATAPAVALNGLKSVIPFSSRLRTGRALAVDVWSIFKFCLESPPDCINLGQGYMNFSPPEWVKDAVETAISTVQFNHYSHPKGSPRLRRAISNHYSSSFGRTLNPDSEILVTSGANEGEYATFVAFLEAGDEVIMFEPFFDQYLPSVTFNGGVPVFVPLDPPSHDMVSSTSDDWTLDFNALRRAITSKTKMIIVNTPHNPVGKVFTKRELEYIARLAQEFNLLVLSDEVYDCMVFSGREHVRIATLPGMWERTITVGSAGKSFAATGWRIGWLVGPSQLLGPALAASTRIVFCSNTPMQEAAAAGLEQANERKFFEKQLQEYEERRDVLVSYFSKLGIKYTLPEGTYFVLVDISDLQIPDDYVFPSSLDGRGLDFKACWFLAQEVGVSSIPNSEFYCDEHRNIGERFARFAFCKDVETLRRAGERLQGLKKFLKQ
ncbi:pyridoxal phosphate-dependent transferase [Gautieria morchelliformis]|nr:pyridoxal phosphate-dependent transferase [Gautieria morchelliformis]